LTSELKRIAVFIDAENIPANCADALFSEMAKRGKISFCRAYGDFNADRMKAWESKIKAHKISSFQQDSVSNYKNAADISLVIGAMDIVHWKRAERFYIVSNDGDFTPLANRIKAEGFDVIGIGVTKASAQFQTACNDFVFLTPAKETKVAKPAPEAAPVKPVQTSPVKTPNTTKQMQPRKIPPLIRAEIIDAVKELTATGEPVLLAQVHSKVKELFPEFNFKDLNYTSLSKLFKNITELDVVNNNRQVRLVKGAR